MVVELFPLGIWHYLIGGLIIGLGMGIAYLMSGIVAGASSLFTVLWSFVDKKFCNKDMLASRDWRIYLAIGTVLGGFVFMLFSGASSTQIEWWRLLLGGFIAGLGARMANGCTSGHGICGLSSLQLSSLISVVIFLVVALITANVLRMVGV
ncbi:YeeE/YedE family protein [Candidatus Woesearchaeota archaeon]|nr:YeeE/YedE family protein [Candidatus Woesearchaeota archaeon]